MRRVFSCLKPPKRALGCDFGYLRWIRQYRCAVARSGAFVAYFQPSMPVQFGALAFPSHAVLQVLALCPSHDRGKFLFVWFWALGGYSRKRQRLMLVLPKAYHVVLLKSASSSKSRAFIKFNVKTTGCVHITNLIVMLFHGSSRGHSLALGVPH